ncbi:MAG: hypothetical protein JW900_15730 [Anaerolineae bacterium]|nr:hypothetical protein [Anaerolineae bacterium]
MIDQIASFDHLYRTFVRIQLRHWDGHPSRSRFPPGVDGETLPAFAQDLNGNLQAIGAALRDGTYRFSPMIERKFAAPGGREKHLSQATLRDTLVQKAVAAVVEPALDPLLPASLHAFRQRRPRGPGLHQALSQAAEASRAGRWWILQEDIHAYFDHIRHNLLLESLAPFLAECPRVLDVYTAYLNAPRWVKGCTIEREIGLPIGSVLSNSLANIYLLPLDEAMARAGFCYLRYCDDLLVIADSKTEALAARELIREIAGCRGLGLNPQKSQLSPPGAPFVYLGYEFHGRQLRVGPRALAKFRRKVRHVTARQRWPRLKPSELETPRGRVIMGQLIRQVNQLVAGSSLGAWSRYFARANFDDQFRELDNWIHQRIRAALFHRWREGDARHLSQQRLQALGLRSLVGEHWRWRNNWRRQSRSLLARAARLDSLRESLEQTKARAWDPYRRRHRFHPGPDGLTLDDVAADERAFLLALQSQLLSGEYRFGPFVEYGRPRQGREEPRWIARPGLADAVVARALAAALTPYLDASFPDTVYSYRPGKGSWAAIGQLRRHLLAAAAPWVVRADVAGYLDQVDLPRLAAQLDTLLPANGEMDETLRGLLHSYLWSGRWRAAEGLLPRTQGLPRGGPLTPLLGNLYLLPLDAALAAGGFCALRYGDDVLVVAADEPTARAAWAAIQEQAAALDLTLSPAKSGIFAPGSPFEFLGYRITGHHMDVRPYAVNRLKRRVRRLTQRRRWQHLTVNSLQTPTGREELAHLVHQINRLIVYRGGHNWVRRFARCTDDAAFRTLDRWIADRIRACVTGRWSPRNRRLVPDELLRELGLVKMVPLYYHARQRIAGQAVRAALAQRIAPSPEAGE